MTEIDFKKVLFEKKVSTNFVPRCSSNTGRGDRKVTLACR